MSGVNSAVARAVNEFTDFRAAQVRKATFSEAVSQTEKAGLESNKKSAETLILLADIRSINTRLGDIISEAWQGRWHEHGAFFPRQTGKANKQGRGTDKRMSRDIKQVIYCRL